MTTDTQEIGAEDVGPVAVARPIQGDVIDAYESMIEQIPDAGNDGFEGILEAIAAATSASDLDAPWNANGLGKLVGVPIVVLGVRKMPSEYEGPLPYFLVVDGAVRATGERFAATTGSLGCVAQLARAFTLGAFPWTCIPRLARKPTKEGYYPMHLESVKD